MMDHYIPGVCNIGPEEIARRRRVGWIGLVVAVFLLFVLVMIGADPWWRLLIFFPAAFSASGFLQAYFQFCSGFARAGVFNFGHLGITHDVTDDLSKAKDKRRGGQIMLYALAAGALVALVALLA